MTFHRFVARVTRREPHVEQEPHALLDNLISLPLFLVRLMLVDLYLSVWLMITTLVSSNIKAHYRMAGRLREHTMGYLKLLYLSEMVIIVGNAFVQVKTWLTINQPIRMAKNMSAPGQPISYVAGKHLLLAHADVYHLYKRTYKKQQQGMINFIVHHYSSK